MKHKCLECGTELLISHEPCPVCLPEWAWRPKNTKFQETNKEIKMLRKTVIEMRTALDNIAKSVVMADPQTAIPSGIAIRVDIAVKKMEHYKEELVKIQTQTFYALDWEPKTE